MRFFTDNFFTEAQKTDMLGNAYGIYVKDQQMEKQLDQARLLRQREAELSAIDMRSRQMTFEKNARRMSYAALAFIILFATLTSGFGSLVMSGHI